MNPTVSESHPLYIALLEGFWRAPPGATQRISGADNPPIWYS